MVGPRMNTTDPTAARRPVALENALEGFLRALAGKTRSPATIAAYRTDLGQFFGYLAETNYTASSPDRIEKADISDYLAYLGQRKLSGVSRARKLAAIREFFRHLVDHDVL